MFEVLLERCPTVPKIRPHATNSSLLRVLTLTEKKVCCSQIMLHFNTMYYFEELFHFFLWEKFWLPFLLAYYHFSFKLWLLCGCFLTSCLSEFILVLHVLEAKVLNLSRRDVFTLLPNDFNDLFRTWYAPCNKTIYLSLCVRCVRCGILRSVLFCLKIRYFSQDCHA